MKISEITTSNPACISPQATLVQAAMKMKLLGVGMLPVCDEGRLVGSVTDRDIVVRGIAEGVDPGQILVKDVMTKDLIWCFDDQDVQEAAQLMEDKQIRRLPVMDRQKHLVGIVSIGDLATRTGQNELGGKVLEHVSKSVFDREPWLAVK